MSEDKKSTPINKSEADEFYEVYEYHSNQLRIWFVAYGIGGPVLIVSNGDLWRALANTWPGITAVTLFLIAVSAQILLTMLNKALMWAVYFGKKKKLQHTWWYKNADKISEKFWLDLAIDFATGIFMLIATGLVFYGVAISAPPTG